MEEMNKDQFYNSERPNDDGNPINDGIPGSEGLYFVKATTKKEFLNLPEGLHWKKECRLNAIVCFCIAGLTLILGTYFYGYFVIFDAAVVAVLGLILLFKQSRIAALLILAYSLYNVITVYLATGNVSGWLLVLVGVSSVINTFRTEKAWKEYQKME